MHGLKHSAAFVCPAHEEDLISAAWQLGLFLLLALPPSSAPMHARTRASSPSGHRRKVVDAVVFGEGASFNERAAMPCRMEHEPDLCEESMERNTQLARQTPVMCPEKERVTCSSIFSFRNRFFLKQYFDLNRVSN